MRSILLRGSRPWPAVAGLSILLAVGLSACGGSSTKASSSTTATTKPGTPSTAAYTTCLEQHGIPSSAANQLAAGGRRGAGGGAGGPGGPEAGGPPPSLPGGVTAAQLRTANQACRSLDPNRGRFGGGQFNSAAFAAYRNCLQLHGVTLPTPGSSTTTAPGSGSSPSTPGGGRGLGGLDPNNPTVQAAMQACAALRPGPNGSTTTTTSAA